MCQKISKMSDADIDIYSNKLHKELGFSMSTINTLVKSFKDSNSTNHIAAVKDYQKFNNYQDMQLRVLSSMLDSPDAIEIFIESFLFLENEAYRKISLLIGEYYRENKDSFNMEYMIADLFTKVSTDFGDDDEMIKTLSLIDNVKDNYPPYNKESFNDLLFELQEIVPLQNKYEQIMEEIKYANSTEEKNNYIRKALALKTMIKEKRSKKVGGK